MAISSLFLDWLKAGTIEERVSEIRKAIKAKELVVAVDKDKNLIGVVHSLLHNDPISSGPLLFITSLYVQEPFRGKGLGSRLLRFALRMALEKGAVGAEVSTVHPRAIRFYKRFGFFQFRGEIGEILLGLDLKKGSLRKNLQTF